VGKRISNAWSNAPLQRCNEVSCLLTNLVCLLFTGVCLLPEKILLEASFYPGLNVDSILDVQSDNLAEIPDEAHFEDEEDWICIPTMSELSRGRTSKFSESVMKEVSSRYLT
jgi:hypothetical protein